MDSIIWFINFSVMSSNKLEYELITKNLYYIRNRYKKYTLIK